MRSYLERLRAGSPVRSRTSDRLTEAGLDHAVRDVAGRQWERVLRARLQEEVQAYCAQPSMEGLAEITDIVEALADVEAPDGGGAALTDARAVLAQAWGSYGPPMALATLDPTPMLDVNSVADDATDRPDLNL